MQVALEPFNAAYAAQHSWALAHVFSPEPPPNNPGRLYDFYCASNAHQVANEIRNSLRSCQTIRLSKKEEEAWTDILRSYWSAVGEILRADEAAKKGRLDDGQRVRVYETWRDLTTNILNNVQKGSLPAWTVVCMYNTAHHLRVFAIKADEQLATSRGNVALSTGLQDDVVGTATRSEKLEDAARLFSKILGACSGDRDADLHRNLIPRLTRNRNPDMRESRKWGVYYMANLQFKTYFKLKTINLSLSVVKGIRANTDLPNFELYPAAHRVTYQYYVGVLAFLQEDYTQAESCLTYAWDHCHPEALKNQELILTYLIPCRLITKHNVPSRDLLSSYPGLQRIFGPLVACIKHGNLSGFDNALSAAEDGFVRRRLYLALERGRDIALRNLLRKVFIAEGYEELKEGETEANRVRKSRVPLARFAAALRMGASEEGGGQILEDEEVECILANMIYKGLMKGYISRTHSMVVLNKKGAFPGTGV